MAIKIQEINRWYHKRMYDPATYDYYEDSEFFNFGYWKQDTSSQKDACFNLMEALLDLVPEKSGKVLDVACGKGATTRHLQKYFEPSDISAIDISQKQLGTSRATADGANFALANAVELPFLDNSFDLVICVEAAFHFDVQQDFIREAYRVLKPNGRLILTDILFRKWADTGRHIRTSENYVRDLNAYRYMYSSTNFQEIQVIDASLECWHRFYANLWRYHWRTVLQENKDFSRFGLFLPTILVGICAVRHYLLVSVQKGQ